MQGKTVLVTGANSGMGLATTVEMARRGATVIMACRSLKRGKRLLPKRCGRAAPARSG